MGWHEDTVRKIGEYCITKFGDNNVQIHISKKSTDRSDEKIGINSLPILKNSNKRKDNLYFPDIVVRDNQNQITHLIEVAESSPGSPVSVLGVIFAADIAIYIMKNENTQDTQVNPKLFFIIPDPNINDNIYRCSICDRKHKKGNTDHLIWMKKDRLEIKKCLDNIDTNSKEFFCPICKRIHRINHNHLKWLKLRSSQNYEIEEISKENELTRLFGKILKNEEIKAEIENRIKNIDFPVCCYETDYDYYI